MILYPHEYDLLPSCVGGIYFMFSNDKVMYIGLTACFRLRLTSKRYVREFLRFGITHYMLIEVNKFYRIELERQLIEFFSPPLNKVYNIRKTKLRKFYNT